jgi:hypothetical protein
MTLSYNSKTLGKELRRRFQEFQDEMKQKGILLEMRLISTKKGYDTVAHDRFLISEKVKYNVPSFTTVIKGRFSEIKRTNNVIPFMDYWNNNDSLDFTLDWPKIKAIRDKTKMTYETNCFVYGKVAHVPFKPDGVRLCFVANV